MFDIHHYDPLLFVVFVNPPISLKFKFHLDDKLPVTFNYHITSMTILKSQSLQSNRKKVTLNGNWENSDTFLFCHQNSLSVVISHNNVAEVSTLTYGDLDIWGVTQHVQDVRIVGLADSTPLIFDWDYDSATKVFV